MEDALAGKEKGIWVRYSSEQYIDNVNNISCGLLALGLKKGDKVATISNNRPQWNFIDMGVAQVGIIHVPIYPTISKEEYEYILKDCEPSLVFVSEKGLYEKIKPIADAVGTVKDVYTINEVEGAKNLSDIIELGRKSSEKYEAELSRIKDSVKAGDFFTLLYTSGTTGFPKGVMLCHNNVVSNFKATAEIHDLVRNRRPEGGEASTVNAHPLPPHEVGEGAAVEQIEFHLVVPVRPGHRLRCPPLAGKTIGHEFRTPIVKVHHDLRIQ